LANDLFPLRALRICCWNTETPELNEWLSNKYFFLSPCYKHGRGTLYLCSERLLYFSPPFGIEKHKNVATMDASTVPELAGEVIIYPKMHKLTVHLLGKPFVGEVTMQMRPQAAEVLLW